MRAARVSASISVAVLAVSLSAHLASPAAALEPGVHVDPGSPAAKEYALPVNEARGTGEETSHGPPQKLFGAGIKPPSSGSGSSRGQRPGAAHSRAKGSASPTVDGAPAQASPPAVQQVANRSTSGGGASVLVLFGGGVAILVLGVFAGIVLRHSRRPSSAS
jgi:hypothetical protein